jgi:hypothetical protein
MASIHLKRQIIRDLDTNVVHSAFFLMNQRDDYMELTEYLDMTEEELLDLSPKDLISVAYRYMLDNSNDAEAEIISTIATDIGMVSCGVDISPEEVQEMVDLIDNF